MPELRGALCAVYEDMIGQGRMGTGLKWLPMNSVETVTLPQQPSPS